MSELVSIIVPVYQAKSYIAETIAMVKRQTYKEWELILVEDCSPDDSAEIIRNTLGEYGYCSAPVEHRVPRDLTQEDTPLQGQEDLASVEEYIDDSEQRVILICKARNGGAAVARNIGLSMARGRYIAFLDADDVWFPEKLDKELRFMGERHAGFVFTAYEFGDEEAHPTGKKVHVPESLTYRRALSRTVIFTTTVMFDREMIPDKLMRMPAVESEDTATWWQILRAGYTAYGLDEVLAVYRRPVKSLSSNKLVAIKRIWNLYRRQEKLSFFSSACHFILWAYRATVRRL